MGKCGSAVECTDALWDARQKAMAIYSCLLAFAGRRDIPPEPEALAELAEMACAAAGEIESAIAFLEDSIAASKASAEMSESAFYRGPTSI